MCVRVRERVRKEGVTSERERVRDLLEPVIWVVEMSYSWWLAGISFTPPLCRNFRLR